MIKYETKIELSKDCELEKGVGILILSDIDSSVPTSDDYIKCTVIPYKDFSNKGVSDKVTYQGIKCFISDTLDRFSSLSCENLIIKCGEFNSYTHMIATAFRDLLEQEYFGYFNKITFSASDKTFDIFENVFSEVL